MGREYRVFIYNKRVLEYGYYWDGNEELSQLSQQEEKEVLNLASLASQHLNVPYIASKREQGTGNGEQGLHMVWALNPQMVRATDLYVPYKSSGGLRPPDFT